MTSDMPIAHSSSMSSTISANNGAHQQPAEDAVIGNAEPHDGTALTDSTNASNNERPEPTTAPGLPKPVAIRAESRDTSMCSRNSRDSLRRSVSMRSSTFTELERLFLEQLTVEGTDAQVEAALRTVEDEELFFADTPVIGNNNSSSSSSSNINININIGSSTSTEDDDATRDGVALSVATSERRGLDKSATSSLTSSSRTGTATAVNAKANSSLGSIPSAVAGSSRRREVLERRRSESSLNLATLWRAHQSGLAVTQSGSRRSLLRRESSISSIGSNMSGLSILVGNRAHPGASREDVFRSDGAAKPPAKASEGSSGGFRTPPKPKLPRQHQPFVPRSLPLASRRPQYRRSKSVTLDMISPQRSLPRIPEPNAVDSKPTHHRSRSTLSSSGRRKSVTFHDIDEELEFDKDRETSAVTPIDAVDTAAKKPQNVRRVVSDSQIAIPAELQNPNQALLMARQRRDGLQRETSMSSIPSLHRGAPIRQDSLSSIPSLHHGHPLQDSVSVMDRQQSTASIPSLHHGQPIRDSVFQDSVTSFASIRHGNPLAESPSAASIPSIRHGNPLRDSLFTTRQSSVATFGSIRQGNPIRQESTSTLPSLHPARPIRQDSVASSVHVPSGVISMSRQVIAQQFGVSAGVASAWVQLERSEGTLPEDEPKRVSGLSSDGSVPSIPHDVTLPMVNTAADAEDELSMRSPTCKPLSKPVLLRQATRNTYEGEGFEVTEMKETPMIDDEATEAQEAPIIDGPLSEADSYYYRYTPDQNVFRDNVAPFPDNGIMRTAGSFDDLSLFSSFGKQQHSSEIFRDIRRSLSDDNMSTISNLVDHNREFLLQIPTSSDGQSEIIEDDITDGGSTSWEMGYGSPREQRFDAWNIIQDEYVNGYGGAGTLGFSIFGTSLDDEASKPHVLSPPLMESLQAFLPSSKSGQNFHMKYSMIRDGASLQTLLRKARGIKYSILAIETIDGEVFGSFTGQAWRKSWNYFGTGESFLWRMRHSRLEKSNGILDQAQKESEIDVYPYTGENGFIQLCTHDRIAVGGGIPDETYAEKKSEELNSIPPLAMNTHDWGFGLALQSDLLQGSSSPCVTFGSPSLCKSQPIGSRFEVMNVELWTTTPCMTEEEAERLDLGKLFLGSGNTNVNESLTSNFTY
ncbi:unnamed protein product [Pseudo-nitzschia multistriata]|uniref:Oxidation resistance protein 1 n=1 Tax=Pseudo-nitzschia multistriata TaxID=183589 RepID=A0A448ZCB9_9STRA|nr:unnamed protein product [Pseudo-nitzschia multistriata]